MRQHTHTARRRVLGLLGFLLGVGGMLRIDAQQAPGCQVAGKATSGGVALPGVAILLKDGGAIKGATSTDPDGTYRLPIAPGAYQLVAELTGFTTIERAVTLTADACAPTVDLALGLAPRAAREAAAPGPVRTAARGAAPGAAPRFEALAVEQQAAATAVAETITPERDPAAALLLPPGFSTEGPTQALAVTGSMASIDRGMMADRMEAIGRGEFDPVTGEFRPGFEPPGPGEGGRGGRGGGRGGMGPGGGPGEFMMGGRGRGQNAYNVQANYTLAGSALESAPYQLRPDSPARQQPYTRQSFGATVGGPVRIPGVYNGQRRTTFTLNYGGTRGGNLFDQYATVPTEALRAGDFSAAGATVLDPLTGQPFDGNRIPAPRIAPQAQALLRFLPLPNLPGNARNFHYTTTTDSVADNVNLRVTHMLTTPPQGGRGGGRGMGGGFGGRMGGPGGGAAQQGLNVTLTAQLQYRRNDNEQINVFPTLGGESRGSTLSLPVGLNVMKGRHLHTVNVTFSRTASESVNQYAYVEDVAGGAGITGVSTDPFAWGVPQLSFSGFTAVRDLTPSARRDRRLALAYGWTRSFTRHTLRAGGDVRFDHSGNQTDTNARGSFVFTGLHASGGAPVARSGGLDFADFLLGLPQQASVQYGPGNVRMEGRSLSLFVQDDWRRSGSLTFNLGLRYELLQPFAERDGRMVNLDPAADFTAVAPVVSGGTGPFHGTYPKALLRTDANNLAPRVGVAWRAAPGTIVRAGYGVSYNSGSYASIARQLAGQPPFAVTNAVFGTRDAPLSFADPFASAPPSETTNTYGVDPDYALGVVQTWNADLSRDLGAVWNVGASYTHTRGSSLDILRAPNRNPDGLRIPGVQPFLWQSSEGSSVLHAGTFRARRRPVRGIGAGVTYTLARSRDNASSLGGGGGGTVAQDDRNLAAEWGLSSFDRRHQLAADTTIELPFGPNRPWLASGGTWAALLRDWRLSLNLTWQSGTPLTARVQGAVSDVARGTNGSLRADATGQPIRISGPSIDRFFNTAAFAIPADGAFGTSPRNAIVGPGSRLLNAQFSRDVRLGGTRAVTVQVNTNNLLNTVNYGAIDTTVNSPTFGQVLSVRGMRSSTVGVRVRF